MLIYNVTSKVSWEAEDKWIEWMVTEQIREILDTGLFLKYQLVRLLDVEDMDGPTYAVQYYLDNKEDYDRYIRQFAPGIREKAINRWGNHVISFRTLMEVIN
jgi:hypothetical protein